MNRSLDEVRERLAAMRDEIIARLAAADHLDGGMIALLGGVGAALGAVDGALAARKSP